MRLLLCSAGDICYYDEKERFFIVDRMKELIKYKGFQVIRIFRYLLWLFFICGVAYTCGQHTDPIKKFRIWWVDLINNIRQRQKNWLGHVLRGDSLLRTILEGRMEGTRRRGGQSTTMLDWMKSNDEKYEHITHSHGSARVL